MLAIGTPVLTTVGRVYYVDFIAAAAQASSTTLPPTSTTVPTATSFAPTKHGKVSLLVTAIMSAFVLNFGW